MICFANFPYKYFPLVVVADDKYQGINVSNMRALISLHPSISTNSACGIYLRNSTKRACYSETRRSSKSRIQSTSQLASIIGYIIASIMNRSNSQITTWDIVIITSLFFSLLRSLTDPSKSPPSNVAKFVSVVITSISSFLSRLDRTTDTINNYYCCYRCNSYLK